MTFLKNKKLIIIAIVILIGCSSRNNDKLMLGGYAEGSIINHILKVYPNYTYELVTFNNINGSWCYQNDTIVLLNGMDTCAKIYKEKLMSNSCKELNTLRIMEFVENEEPAIIKFPKNN